MKVWICVDCERKLRQTQYLVETGEAERFGRCDFCMPEGHGTVRAFEMSPIRTPRPRKKQDGPAQRDRRPRYREPWRSWQ